jgi:hypothetical protein
MPHYFRNETAAHLALGAARYVKLVLWASISELGECKFSQYQSILQVGRGMQAHSAPVYLAGAWQGNAGPSSISLSYKFSWQVNASSFRISLSYKLAGECRFIRYQSILQVCR